MKIMGVQGMETTGCVCLAQVLMQISKTQPCLSLGVSLQVSMCSLCGLISPAMLLRSKGLR